MTTSPTQQPVVADPVEVKPEDPTNADLRDYARRMKDENAALRQSVVGNHLDAIGLAADKGLGKAIAKDYDGDPPPEAVAAYAKSEYGYDAPAAPAAAEPAAQALADQQQAVDAITGESAPVTPTTRLDKIAQHDATLAKPEATRADAEAAIVDKLAQYLEDTR